MTKTGAFFDHGFHPSVKMTDNGTIVEVHESGNGDNGLFYRIGLQLQVRSTLSKTQEVMGCSATTVSILRPRSINSTM